MLAAGDVFIADPEGHRNPDEPFAYLCEGFKDYYMQIAELGGQNRNNLAVLFQDIPNAESRRTLGRMQSDGPTIRLARDLRGVLDPLKEAAAVPLSEKLDMVFRPSPIGVFLATQPLKGRLCTRADYLVGDDGNVELAFKGFNLEKILGTLNWLGHSDWNEHTAKIFDKYLSEKGFYTNVSQPTTGAFIPSEMSCLRVWPMGEPSRHNSFQAAFDAVQEAESRLAI